MNLDVLFDIIQNQLQNIAKHEVYQSILSFLIACSISITSIPVIINIANLLGITKPTNFRSSHKYATPEFGGIAIYSALLISHYLWPHATDAQQSYLNNLLVVSITILFFLGLKDDILVLDPNKKLLIQILAASILIVMGGLRIDSLYGIAGIYELAPWVSVLLTIFIFIVIINAVNLIDGVDGLAGGIGIIASLTFGSWFLLNQYYSIGCLAYSLAGALLGYLRFNFSKTSKIFMGDTGSLLVGFLLAYFAVTFITLNAKILGSPQEVFHAPVLAMAVLVVPIYDTLRVFLVRILNGHSPFKADRNHFHHILTDNKFTHLQTSLTMWSFTIFVVAGYFATRSSLTSTAACLVLIGLFIFYLVVGYFLKLRAVKVKREVTWPELIRASNRASYKGSFARRIIRNL
jgi:UDP-GlcNAc:undecaprenyl-phosphate/decaprenyl-phosphate GlcNAc-1-phosphate transferase